jgi:predicted SAM-dependent methyltransferase
VSFDQLKIKKIVKTVPFAQNLYDYYKSRIVRYKLTKVLQEPIVKIELGSGSRKGINGWVTIDLYGADINMDLRKSLPLPKESVDEFFASHFLEHLNFYELQNFLTECFEQLKFNGKFLGAVPDASIFVTKYINKEHSRESLSTIHKKSYNDTNSSIDQLNYIAYMGGEHKYMFDRENLFNIFLSNGFRECKLREFISSFDSEEHQDYTIYFEATK